MSPKDREASLVGTGAEFLAVPFQFITGLVVGLAAPIAAIGAMVAGIRLLTGKVPFLDHAYEDAQGERRLSIKLVAPDEVEGLFAQHKETIGKDLMALQAEIKAIMEEAKAGAQKAAPEEIEVPPVAGA